MGDLDPVRSLFRHAADTPNAPAVITPGESVDYAALAGRVEAMMRRWRRLGAGAGTVVSLDLSSDVEGISTLLGLHALDAVVRPVAEPAEPAVSDTAERAMVHVATSGSSGSTRLVRLSAQNVAAAIRSSQERLGNSADDSWLLCLPLHHVAGLSVVWRTMAAGGAVVALPRFEAGLAASALSERAIVASFVPTMLRRVLEKGHRFDSVRWVLVGGAATGSGLIGRGADAGLQVLASYGMSETASQVATVAPGEVRASIGTVGRPLAGMAVELADDGEILVDGHAVFVGYVGEEDRSGPHHTGDLGSIDGEGKLIVHGRRDDAITSGGETVHPATVEAALEEHPAVEAAVVFGVADDDWGERVVAVVQATEIGGPQLSEWLRGRVARHETPKAIQVVDDLPRLSSGKVDRSAVHEARAM